ncbi:MAG: AbrB/MazE/SpoVT family DNA-binding domain-containing protein [Oscillospiraceae bacterium]|nr:AbrB/MazE/SpoVT family DNA-binding domain-containing protein [Oscillospiraceae bacterium]
MYNNKIRRKIDCRGRVVIPKHIRDVFKLELCEVEVFTENDLICIRKFTDRENEKTNRVTSVQGTSGCNYCLCQSCNGFGCPWVAKIYRTGWSIGRMSTERCRICSSTPGFKRIHDCDFYTSKKRVKFYYKRKVKPINKHDVIMRELSELKSLLTKR